MFDDVSSLLDVDDDADEARRQRTGPPELSGLHAKVFVGERYRRAAVYLGSANATEAAFDPTAATSSSSSNSTAWRTHHGTKAVRTLLQDANLLTPFNPRRRAGVRRSVRGPAADTRTGRARLAAGGLRAASSRPAKTGWRTILLATRPIATSGGRQAPRAPAVTAHPAAGRPRRRSRRGVRADRALVSDSLLRAPADRARRGRQRAAPRLPPSGSHWTALPAAEPRRSRPSCSQTPTACFAFHPAAARRRRRQRPHAAPSFEDAPHRADRRRQLAGASGGAGGLPLLEPMLRALHRAPERLDEIDRLLADMRTAGASTDRLLPPELEELWATITEVRESRREHRRRHPIRFSRAQRLSARDGRARLRPPLRRAGLDAQVPRRRRGRARQDDGGSRRRRQGDRPAQSRRRRSHRHRLHLLERRHRRAERPQARRHRHRAARASRLTLLANRCATCATSPSTWSR